MKHLESKTKVSTIALILLLTLSAVIITLPAVMAQYGGPGTTWNTWAICTLTPDVVGVNQPVLVAMGITRQSAWPQAGWKGITVTVGHPDGASETLGPFMTDTTGLTGTIFTPTQVGTYTFQVHFPQQVTNTTAAGVLAGTTLLASDSDIITLTVNTEPAVYFPAAQQPTGYWSRPINAQNREWAWMAGNYLSQAANRVANRIADSNQGPTTAHIIWDYVLAEGGVVGGALGSLSYETGDAYEGKWSNPVIVDGILISNRHTRGTQEVFAINVRTGEELWSKELGDSTDFASVHYWDTMNMHGAFAYVWTTQGSTWRAWDPLTGRNEYNMTGVPGGTNTYGPRGEILRYSLSTGGATLRMWNSTAAFYQRQLILDGNADNPAYPAGRWRPIGTEFDAGNGTQYEVPITSGLEGSALVYIPLDRVIGGNTEWAGGAPIQDPQFWAIDLRPGHEGELIFNEPWQLPEQGLHVSFTGSRPYSVEDDVFVLTAKETRLHYGLSMTTGQQMWATDWFEPYFNSFANNYLDPWGQAVCAEGLLITGGMGGAYNAYDLTDGSHVWEYQISDPFSESLFGNNWPAPTGFITDGKLYGFHMEHSVINPMPRGAPSLCLNLTTGEEIWRINGLRMGTRWGGQPIIGDSVIVGFSSYDNTLTALAKGPSETTITTPQAGVARGGKVLLSGTVMDISPGTKETRTMLRFPDGVPAVADASMSEWMLYVYKTEQVNPMDIMGVTVQLEAYDPEGEYLYIGAAQTDMYGNYGLEFTPAKEGTYWIMASFKESGAYYGSVDTAYLAVGPAVSASGPITPETGTPIITTEVAIVLVAAIAAIVIIAYLVIQKRK